jgi:hypothetical protein
VPTAPSQAGAEPVATVVGVTCGAIYSGGGFSDALIGTRAYQARLAMLLTRMVASAVGFTGGIDDAGTCFCAAQAAGDKQAGNRPVVGLLHHCGKIVGE